MTEDWGSFIPFFRELNRSQLNQIKKISKIYNCKSGDIVYLQGEFCQNWVIINQGSFLSRVKDDEAVFENILHEGESFDFKSIITSSVTTCSLEAIEDSSILVIDILGLKKLANKHPITISLIKEQFNEEEAGIWHRKFLAREFKSKDSSYKIRRSFISLFLKSFPVLFLTVLVPVIVLYFTSFSFKYLVISFILLLGIIAFLFYYALSRLTTIEVNREYVIKRVIDLKTLKSVNSSLPIDKVSSTSVNYKNRLLRVLKIGDITFESASEELLIKGVFRPDVSLSGLAAFKNGTVNINRAIEVSSFKSLYCQKNGLFCIDSQLEVHGNKDFSFKKSILFFLVRGIPPFIVFLFSSVALSYIFSNNMFFLLNIFSVLYLLWHYWDWMNDKYAFEGSKVIDIEKKPLWGKEKRIEADITSVQSIKKEQKNFLEIIFNFGTIEVETLGEKIIYPFIHNPDKVIENLYLVKQYYHSMSEGLNKLNRQEEFLNYTKYYQELSGQ